MKAKAILIISILCICFLVLCHDAKAQVYFYTGNDLVEWMRVHESFTERNSVPGDIDSLFDDVRWSSFYIAYIMGVHDANYMQYSISETVNVAQVSAVVTKYLKEHPERWGEPAATLVIDALKEAFPKDHTE